MITGTLQKKAHEDINHIFENILPEYGMKKRKEQIKLSHEMLDAMFQNSIALSDAGTGIGKTYAYLVAGVVFSKYREFTGEPKQPIVVSTATIALQKAVQEEYIPFLSKVLLESGYVCEPILSAVRKGKSRYVCDKRLKKRLGNIDLARKNGRNVRALFALAKHFDMDEVEHLSNYDRQQVAVPRVCDCGDNCRFHRYVSRCSDEKYLFQICNHNLLLADAMTVRAGQHHILPAYSALVIDEAHKFPAAARQMLGRTLEYEEILTLVNCLRYEQYPLAASYLIDAMKPIVKGMNAESDKERVFFEQKRPQMLRDALKQLYKIKRAVGLLISHNTSLQLSSMIATVELFLDEESDIILYVDEDEHGRPALCAAAADLSTQINKILWSADIPILLTSGTLAVGKDFARFKEEACLTDCGRVTESVSRSPFDYEKNCLMYIPYSTPYYSREKLGEYYEDMADEIADLLKVSNGHALVLFNSYSAMSAIREFLEDYEITQPMFVLNRNNPKTLAAFKGSGNGILLATGAAWEGMDFPGDLVSMLIIPRLPFPIPDAFSDHEKEKYETLKEFIHAIALPDMQIKMRQGFGRAIRLGTDTCVVAILDERALRYRRYHDAVRQALPDMPMTGSARSIERFLRKVKGDAYFAEVRI